MNSREVMGVMLLVILFYDLVGEVGFDENSENVMIFWWGYDFDNFDGFCFYCGFEFIVWFDLKDCFFYDYYVILGLFYDYKLIVYWKVMGIRDIIEFVFVSVELVFIFELLVVFSLVFVLQEDYNVVQLSWLLFEFLVVYDNLFGFIISRNNQLIKCIFKNGQDYIFWDYMGFLGENVIYLVVFYLFFVDIIYIGEFVIQVIIYFNIIVLVIVVVSNF